MAPVYTELRRERHGRQRHEDHRRHAHAVRLGRHPADAVRPAQPVRGLERARPAAHPHRRGRRGPRLPRVGVECGDHRRAGPDHASQAGADGPGSAASRALSAICGRSSGPTACAPSARSTWRCGISGARRSASRSIACSAPTAKRCRPMRAPPCCCARGLCRAGAAVQGARLGRLQDPSADALAGGHQGLRGGAQGGRRLHHHARFDLGLRLPDGGAGRPRRRGDGLLLVRGPAGTTRTSTTT